MSREKAAGARGLDRVRDVVQKKSYSGTIDVEIPTAFEPAVIATTLSLPLAAEGDYKLEAALVVSGNEIDRTEFSRRTRVHTLAGAHIFLRQAIHAE